MTEIDSMFDYEAECERLQEVLEDQRKTIRELQEQIRSMQITVDRQNHTIEKYKLVVRAVEVLCGEKLNID